MVDDREGSMTMLTNVEPEEITEIHAISESSGDVPTIPFEKRSVRH